MPKSGPPSPPPMGDADELDIKVGGDSGNLLWIVLAAFFNVLAIVLLVSTFNETMASTSQVQQTSREIQAQVAQMQADDDRTAAEVAELLRLTRALAQAQGISVPQSQPQPVATLQPLAPAAAKP